MITPGTRTSPNCVSSSVSPRLHLLTYKSFIIGENLVFKEQQFVPRFVFLYCICSGSRFTLERLSITRRFVCWFQLRLLFPMFWMGSRKLAQNENLCRWQREKNSTIGLAFGE